MCPDLNLSFVVNPRTLVVLLGDVKTVLRFGYIECLTSFLKVFRANFARYAKSVVIGASHHAAGW